MTEVFFCRITGADKKTVSAMAHRFVKQKLGTCRDFSYTETGKPYIDGINRYFNISHSADAFAVAISDRPVGIDIEFIRDYNKNILDRYFEGEKAEIKSREDFFKLWTKKEAEIKRLGLTLSYLSKVGIAHCKTVKIGEFMLSLSCEDTQMPEITVTDHKNLEK